MNKSSKPGKLPVSSHIIQLAKSQYGPVEDPLEVLKRAVAKFKRRDLAHARGVGIFIFA
jgi:hypothetical protein